MSNEKKPKLSKEQRQRRAVHRIAMQSIRLEMSRLAAGPELESKIESLETIAREANKAAAAARAEMGAVDE